MLTANQTGSFTSWFVRIATNSTWVKVKQHSESVLITIAHTLIRNTCHEGSNNCVFSQHAEFTIIEQMRFAKAIATSFDEKLDTLHRRELFWQNKLKEHLPDSINKREG